MIEKAAVSKERIVATLMSIPSLITMFMSLFIYSIFEIVRKIRGLER